jgi:hypothetical protein
MINEKERIIIRDLAKRVAEIAAMPVMDERKKLWKQHNSLKKTRPMILIFPEGSSWEILPRSALKCENFEAQNMEWDLRQQIHGFEHFQSDNVVDGEVRVGKVIRDSGWGIEAKWHHSDQPGGARGFDPVILTAADLKKLKHPVIEYDEATTTKNLTQMQELLGDILSVKLVGIGYVSFHMMSCYTSWRGLEQVMLDMYEEPQMLHDAMSFLEQGNHGLIKQYGDQNLLSLNNNNIYHSSGGNGWTEELPAKGFKPDHVRPSDMWASAEAQELAQVSPEMHNEFSLAYEKRLLKPFALNGYGCCEDLTNKLDYVFEIPNLRRISMSPWANVDVCAERLKDNYIFSWKPNPAHLVGHFDPGSIRKYIQHTVDVAKANGCVLEIILKDTHTIENHPKRFDQWTKIAREIVGG